MEVSKGAEVKRNGNLATTTAPRLQFQQKLQSGVTGQGKARLDVSDDGTTWITDVAVWGNADQGRI